ncbi:NTP pyrophosphohydrolase including oxidative damage repair enzyme [Solibacillus silvestris StLB046]|uniref:8-oxo-dGTP diphosphatase n=1 Tax=Solibacillus silvestris (strain StLB046) TaxID=1002809 RepID=F2F7G4_SOLSS|nr:NUDIX domain-containing protein [Solibacillus silvestris]BAK14889.1 NTP pyrophosphohydrolase including oxidative damage repair enzyme [Solibacillus silvestris StLB046]
MNEFKVVVKGVLIKNNRLLIVQRSQIETVGAGTWETVGGNLHFGESFETALKREFSEEVGLNITVKNQLFSTTFHTSKTRQIVLLTFLCDTKEEQITVSDEHEQYLWATKDDLLTLLPQEIIEDFSQHNVLDLLN